MYVCMLISALPFLYLFALSRVPGHAATIDRHRQVHWSLTEWTVCARRHDAYIGCLQLATRIYAKFEWMQRPAHVISISIVNLNGPQAPTATIWRYLAIAKNPEKCCKAFATAAAAATTIIFPFEPSDSPWTTSSYINYVCLAVRTYNRNKNLHKVNKIVNEKSRKGDSETNGKWGETKEMDGDGHRHVITHFIK